MFILLAVPNLCLTVRYRFPDKVADISINQIGEFLKTKDVSGILETGRGRN